VSGIWNLGERLCLEPDEWSGLSVNIYFPQSLTVAQLRTTAALN